MLKIGIIGAGNNAIGHAQKFSEFPDRVNITAVADPRQEAAEALAGQCGARAYGDYREFLDEVDMVVISSPNHLHTEQAIAAAERGKHILCEKPMALNSRDAQAMVAAAEANGCRTWINFVVRWTPNIELLKQRYLSGDIGPGLSIFSRRMMPFARTATNSWRHDPKTSGGILYEVLVHEIDWIVDILGFPSNVFARRAARDPSIREANEHLWMNFEFPGGVVATIEGSMVSQMKDFARGAIGWDGALYTGRWGNDLFFENASNRDSPEELPIPKHVDLPAMILDAMEGKAESPLDFAYGAKMVKLCEAVIDSANEGGPVDFDAASV